MYPKRACASRHLTVAHVQISTPIALRWSREYWEYRIRSHAALVMVPDIFQRLLARGFLKMEEVGLLVFDECHHATEDHPYNAIMKVCSVMCYCL